MCVLQLSDQEAEQLGLIIIKEIYGLVGHFFGPFKNSHLMPNMLGMFQEASPCEPDFNQQEL